ncbi:MAG TPA: ACT domain-containing protein, partial [Candidatus Dormibacteraeota bacterium]|nr:ACT domain-containing protein [Candidatus Dormibacteraeota bacterium]
MARDLTVRIEADRPGELAKVVQALTDAGVNIEGIADLEGLVHILARDPGEARSALRKSGYTI